jgi:hypothetical protein
MERRHQVNFDRLNFKILFSTMSYINMFFDFAIVVFNNHMFEIGVSSIHQNKKRSQLTK